MKVVHENISAYLVHQQIKQEQTGQVCQSAFVAHKIDSRKL